MLFVMHLNMMLQRGRESFNTFLGTAMSLQLPVPLIAACVNSRIAPVALYGVEFCIGLTAAETELNRLQASRAKAILDCRGSYPGPWTIWLVECGWTRRLGTVLLEKAIMLDARVTLRPPQHPATQIREVLADGPAVF